MISPFLLDDQECNDNQVDVQRRRLYSQPRPPFPGEQAFVRCSEYVAGYLLVGVNPSELYI